MESSDGRVAVFVMPTASDATWVVSAALLPFDRFVDAVWSEPVDGVTQLAVTYRSVDPVAAIVASHPDVELLSGTASQGPAAPAPAGEGVAWRRPALVTARAATALVVGVAVVAFAAYLLLR